MTAADADAELPSSVGLEDYDGVTMTGSALNIYKGGAPVTRQIELAKAVFAAGVPFFGSCWGLQVAVTAAGGEVRANPRGREFGFARRIVLSDAGREHRLFAGKPAAFEAPTIHKRRDRLAAGGCRRYWRSTTSGCRVRHSIMGAAPSGACSTTRSTTTSILQRPPSATARRWSAKECSATPRRSPRSWPTCAPCRRTRRIRRCCGSTGSGPAMRAEELRLLEIRNWLARRSAAPRTAAELITPVLFSVRRHPTHPHLAQGVGDGGHRLP